MRRLFLTVSMLLIAGACLANGFFGFVDNGVQPFLSYGGGGLYVPPLDTADEILAGLVPSAFWYKFDTEFTNAVGTITDYSTAGSNFGEHGTGSVAPTYFEYGGDTNDGHYANSVLYAADWSKTQSTNLLDGATEFTMGTWIRYTGFGNTDTEMWCKNQSGTGQFGIRQTRVGGNVSRPYVYNEVGVSEYIANLLFDTDKWYHIAFGWRSSDGAIRMYYNGKQSTNDTITSAAIGPLVQDDPIYLMQNRAAGYMMGLGYIMEPFCFDRLITDEEMYELYTNSAARLVPHHLLDTSVYHDFDDTNTWLIDASPYRRDSTIAGGTFWSPVSGGCIDTQGSSDYLITGHSALLEGAESFSLSAWVYPRVRGNYDAIIGNTETDSSADTYITIDMRPTYKWGAIMNFDDISTVSATSPNQVPTLEWQHVTMTWTMSDGYVRLYEDGVLVQTSATTCLIPVNKEATLWKFGGSLAGGRQFNGLIDRARITEEYWDADRAMSEYLDDLGSHPSVMPEDAWYQWNTLTNSAGNYADSSLAITNVGTYVADATAPTFYEAANTNGGFNSTCVYADGGDTANVGTNYFLNGATALTVGMWVRLTEYNSNSGGLIVSRGADYFSLYQNAVGGQPKTWIIAGGTSQTSGSSKCPLNQWAFVVATWDSATGVSEIFVNGRKDNRSAGTTGATTALNQTDYFKLFWDDAGSQFHATGYFDDAMFWDRVLSDAEILSVYDDTKYGVAPEHVYDDSVEHNFDVADPLQDDSPYRLDATFGGDAAFTNVAGGCVHLDGNGDYVQVGHNEMGNGWTNISFGGWYYLLSKGDNEVLLYQRDPAADSNIGMYMGAQADQQFGAILEVTNSATEVTVNVGVPAPTNEWVYLSCAWQKSVGNLLIYTNGVLAGTSAGTITTDLNVRPSMWWVGGDNLGTPSGWAHCYADEIKIENAYWDASTHLANYQGGTNAHSGTP